jgi:hypothetical protein
MLVKVQLTQPLIRLQIRSQVGQMSVVVAVLEEQVA